MAFSYEGMHLWEDALIIYDELEASLEQVLRGKCTVAGPSSDLTYRLTDGNAWVGRSGVDDAANDTEALLPASIATADSRGLASEVGPSSYHERIAGSDFSVFDYRCYIFRRQVELLGRLRLAALLGGRDVEAKQKIAEVAQRSLAFTISLGRWLRENTASADLESFLCAELMRCVRLPARLKEHPLPGRVLAV